MPEIKNTFLEGKMNKDLDARLLKNGEYFDAQNIHITKSEGSDVGTVQNILGNKLNYTTGAFKSGERTIGIVTTNTSDGTNAAGEVTAVYLMLPLDLQQTVMVLVEVLILL